jgi:hypothetical protein
MTPPAPQARNGRAFTFCVALSVIMLFMVASTTALAWQQSESVDLQAIYKIKQEGLQNSQVMEILSWLTDVNGERLTGSPGLLKAAEWSAEKMAGWGMVNANLEAWGPFGRGWTNDWFSAHVLEPRPYSLIGYPKAWTPGTDGPLRGEAIIAVIENEDDFEEWGGKLTGKYVLGTPMREVPAEWEPLAHRLTDAELLERAQQQMPRVGLTPFRMGDYMSRRRFMNRLNEFFVAEGVAGVLDPSRGDGGTVFVGGGGSREVDGDPAPRQVSLAVEHYGRVWRTLEKDVPVVMEMNIKNTFYEDTLDSFNVVAEIPGTDLADEVVIVGGHLDSWHTGTGATDDAAGCAVMMEAARILKATGLPLRRTVRVALWSGEEQGLLGSRAYVTQHYADPTTMELKPEHAKMSAYYNVDNGTGAIRGVYLQGNEAIAPIFEAWMEPFENMGMTTLSIRNTGGTDHLAFDAVGLPGFQFIQDPVEYSTRTHHSNMDVYERIQPADMMKNAVIVASFIYHTANRDEMLPRKPLPEPRPARGF